VALHQILSNIIMVALNCCTQQISVELYDDLAFAALVCGIPQFSATRHAAFFQEQTPMESLLQAVANDDGARVAKLLKADPSQGAMPTLKVGMTPVHSCMALVH
jgi:hypothetical protein